jgi:hypothetical protein
MGIRIDDGAKTITIAGLISKKMGRWFLRAGRRGRSRGDG